MNVAKKIELGAALLLCGLVHHAGPAHATMCGGSVTSKCWADHSGPNYSMVTTSAGAAFATLCPSASTCARLVATYKPSGTTAVSTSNPYLMNQVAGVTNPFVGTANIRSITAHRIPPSVDLFTAGPTRLWALRSDSRLYSSAGDTRFRNSGDYFSAWTLVAQPKDTSNNTLALRSIASIFVPNPYPNAFYALYALSTGNKLYRLIGDKWAPIAPSTNVRLLPGSPGPFGTLALMGTSSSSKDLAIVLGPPGGPNNIADVSSSVSLAGSGYGFVDIGGGTQQPISLGIVDAWFLKSTTSMSGFVYRSEMINGSWTPWSVYDTGTLNGPGHDFPCWNIADASNFRNKRGEFFAIGDDLHLLQFVP